MDVCGGGDTLTGKAAFDKSLKILGIRWMDMFEKRLLYRNHSKCEAPEAGTHPRRPV